MGPRRTFDDLLFIALKRKGSLLAWIEGRYSFCFIQWDKRGHKLILFIKTNSLLEHGSLVRHNGKLKSNFLDLFSSFMIRENCKLQRFVSRYHTELIDVNFYIHFPSSLATTDKQFKIFRFQNILQ